MEIKEIYLSVYKKKLAEEILENYNGVQQRILLGLLDGMCNGIKQEKFRRKGRVFGQCY